MKKQLNPSEILKEARQRAGLTQRELARRAGKAQSVIARIESGKSNPGTATLNQLVEAAGFEIQTKLVIKPVDNSHMNDDISRILSLTPEQRLEKVADTDNFIKTAKSNTDDTDEAN